jgi:hypothetical protein
MPGIRQLILTRRRSRTPWIYLLYHRRLRRAPDEPLAPDEPMGLIGRQHGASRAGLLAAGDVRRRRVGFTPAALPLQPS